MGEKEELHEKRENGGERAESSRVESRAHTAGYTGTYTDHLRTRSDSKLSNERILGRLVLIYSDR